jgi:hypothetical protein
MNAKRAINLSLVLFLTLSLVDAQSEKKLLGAWKTTIDYETYTLEFNSETELSLNGEKYSYTLSDSNIMVDYQNYPYTFKGEELFITAEGYEHKFIRTGEAKKKTSAAEALKGSWENKDEFGTHKVTFHSDSQLEYDGEWAGYSLEDNAIVVDYEKYLFKIENGELMVKWPGETVYRKFTRVKD